MTDHFDGKSLKNRSTEWLTEAFRDAMVKYHACATTEAHARMWNEIAGKYQAEIERRQKVSDKIARHMSPHSVR